MKLHSPSSNCRLSLLSFGIRSSLPSYHNSFWISISQQHTIRLNRTSSKAFFGQQTDYQLRLILHYNVSWGRFSYQYSIAKNHFTVEIFDLMGLYQQSIHVPIILSPNHPWPQFSDSHIGVEYFLPDLYFDEPFRSVAVTNPWSLEQMVNTTRQQLVAWYSNVQQA